MYKDDLRRKTRKPTGFYLVLVKKIDFYSKSFFVQRILNFCNETRIDKKQSRTHFVMTKTIQYSQFQPIIHHKSFTSTLSRIYPGHRPWFKYLILSSNNFRVAWFNIWYFYFIILHIIRFVI